MPHETIVKFGYPATLVREYDHWTVQLRPAQATLGAMVLICKEEETAFSRISTEAFTELPTVIGALEWCLNDVFASDRINYLMLMMVDPHVHFHVLPRYAEERRFAGLTFDDPGWPGPPSLTHATDIDDSTRRQLLDRIMDGWPH